MSAGVVWIGWLVLFLLYEVYAAKAEPKGDTLSENVWDWFGVRGYRPWSPVRRALLFAFMATLTLHFVFGWPGGAAVIIAALPVGAVIAYSVLCERR